MSESTRAYIPDQHARAFLTPGVGVSISFGFAIGLRTEGFVPDAEESFGDGQCRRRCPSGVSGESGMEGVSK